MMLSCAQHKHRCMMFSANMTNATPVTSGERSHSRAHTRQEDRITLFSADTDAHDSASLLRPARGSTEKCSASQHPHGNRRHSPRVSRRYQMCSCSLNHQSRLLRDDVDPARLCALPFPAAASVLQVVANAAIGAGGTTDAGVACAADAAGGKTPKVQQAAVAAGGSKTPGGGARAEAHVAWPAVCAPGGVPAAGEADAASQCCTAGSMPSERPPATSTVAEEAHSVDAATCAVAAPPAAAGVTGNPHTGGFGFGTGNPCICACSMSM